jgi:Na+/citrate or Na+/malate symporter
MNEKNNERTGLWLGGMPWWLTVAAVLLCMIPVYIIQGSGEDASMVQSTSMAGSMAMCLALGVVFNELGERIPIWNKYIGGGLLLSFFGVAIMRQFGLIPQLALDAINSYVSDDANFLEFFIIMLIIGSVLSLDRDILLKSFAGYIPAILGGLVCAMIMGVGTGFIFGVKPADAIIKYVLPIMGGGNGAGAVPLSQIYEQITGDPAATYYSFAIIILTIANLFCIVASAALNALGEKVPSLTGDKKTLLRAGTNLARDDAKIKTDNEDLFGALLLAMA